jgi:hypothetical protein
MPTAVTSLVPTVLTALVTACQASSNLTGVTVVDGPRVADESDQDRLFIGFDPEDDTAVTGDQQFAGMPGRSRDQTFEITCLAEAWTGDTDVPARRARAYQIMAAVEQLLRPTVGDHTLGVPGLLWAQLAGGENLAQRQTSRGAYAGVTFTVTCRARLSVT